MRKIFIFLPILLLFVFSLYTTSSFSTTRGIRVTSKEGQSLYLYKSYHALVVGVSNYERWPKLPNAVNDAKEVASKLKGIGFEVKMLLDPTAREMRTAINEMVYKMGREENRALIFYYAGHGETETLADKTKMGYIIPIDCPLLEKDPMGFATHAISMRDIESASLRIKAKHLLMLFDSCFSGSLFSLVRAVPHDITEKSTLPVRQYITAGREDEQVPDKSMFKRCFLIGLEGDADLTGDGYITASELGMYLSDKVVNYTHRQQHPQYGKINNPDLDRGDFIFALKVPSRTSTKISTAQPPPPEPDGIGDYDKIIKDRKAKKKWTQWQSRMEEDFTKARKYDQSEELTSKEKSEVWDNFLSSYGTENPYSTKDEDLRKQANERRKHWKEHEVTVAKLPPNQESSSSVSVVSKTKEIDHDEIYIALGGGVVRDKKTGLEWLTGYGWHMELNETKSWVEGLSLILGGGWRMPTIDELRNLYVEGYGTHNLTPLLATTSWRIWSGEEAHSDKALAFNFRYGRETSEHPKTTWIQVFVVRKGKSSVDVTYGSKGIKTVSSQEPATVNHSHKADIETLPYTVKVKVGDLRKKVESIYGQPSSIEVLPGYNPPVMRQLKYKSLGLNFYFFRNLLWGIKVYAPFKGEFFGVKIGDFVSQAIALYRSNYTGSYPVPKKGPPHYYEWTNLLPKCTLKVYVMNSRNCEEDKNPIISFNFTDSSKRGTWFPSQFVN